MAIIPKPVRAAREAAYTVADELGLELEECPVAEEGIDNVCALLTPDYISLRIALAMIEGVRAVIPSGIDFTQSVSLYSLPASEFERVKAVLTNFERQDRELVVEWDNQEVDMVFEDLFTSEESLTLLGGLQEKDFVHIGLYLELL